VIRLGHRGAAGVAAPNSLAGVEAALAAGLDGVELDVVFAGGRLLVAHSRAEVGAETPTLAEALSVPTGFLLLDLKEAGHEAELVAALREHDALERALVCSQRPRSLRAARRLEPRLRTSRSYPRDRTGAGERGLIPGPVLRAALATMRAALPVRIAGMLRRSGAEAATLHHLVVSRAVVERCHALGASVLVWTVNDAAALARVEELGVDGLLTDDPALFAS
jgi:glycerophosphoryl diester phosphodiesterase